MMIAAFKWLGIQLVVICVMLGVFSCLVLVINGREDALGFLQTTVVGMKGPWVWTFGYGLAFFIMDRGRALPLALDGVLVPSELTTKVSQRIGASTYHKNALRYTVPLTLLGVFLTYAYGIPNRGLAYVLIYFCVLLIYYISGFCCSTLSKLPSPSRCSLTQRSNPRVTRRKPINLPGSRDASSLGRFTAPKSRKHHFVPGDNNRDWFDFDLRWLSRNCDGRISVPARGVASIFTDTTDSFCTGHALL